MYIDDGTGFRRALSMHAGEATVLTRVRLPRPVCIGVRKSEHLYKFQPRGVPVTVLLYTRKELGFARAGDLLGLALSGLITSDCV